MTLVYCDAHERTRKFSGKVNGRESHALWQESEAQFHVSASTGLVLNRAWIWSNLGRKGRLELQVTSVILVDRVRQVILEMRSSICGRHLPTTIATSCGRIEWSMMTSRRRVTPALTSAVQSAVRYTMSRDLGSDSIYSPFGDVCVCVQWLFSRSVGPFIPSCFTLMSCLANKKILHLG